MTTWHHEERLRAVQDAVAHLAPARVADLGCGDGDLFLRLAALPLEALIGLDICQASLDRLRERLAKHPVNAAQIELRHASMTDPAPDLAGFDCAVLVETIEHIDPDHLSRLERAVFHTMRPQVVIVTTPNAEFNPLLGVPAHRFRHPDHRFEWSRARFRQWCERAARSAGYDVGFHDIAGAHPQLGGASQMAIFKTRDRDE